ncbi:flavin reductase family protein [Alcaligenes faecalis]|uniref:flavin reductase family protein n=1 Tax=Alcaligenes faecalis TaxID=511 RepID=UPI0006C0E2FB|nr:flavin reductase family protein [Alcaligenes faecalis]MCX5593676.1 flavin reductase family protein [Alcaligenes faecalis]QQC31294.1 flavin reductase family protein [Alcaligenes faecalis]CAJ0906133.1 Flavin reductase family protein [Alcaligenes faecalis subsp. faecalis]CUI61040.1 Flavin reductase like domain [Alcaligenes faecalis]GAU71794.1 flavin reductase [Alcaligenes faecalis subsp. faecalis NBRC 13111]
MHTTDISPRYRSLSCEGMDDSMAYRLLTSLIVPRPIAWVCTMEESGSVNLAPFSSFNYVAHSPPMLAININRNDDGSLKDTARNLQASKECVVQLCRESDLAAVHASAAALPPGQSEVQELGRSLVPSQHVRVPRLGGAAVQMECKLDQVVDLGRGVNQLHIMEVLAFHVDSSLMDEKGKVDLEVYRPLARWAGPYYAQRGDIFLP